jgi:hypothetical protein
MRESTSWPVAELPAASFNATPSTTCRASCSQGCSSGLPAGCDPVGSRSLPSAPPTYPAGRASGSAPTFFSSFEPAENRRLVEAAGLGIVRNEVVEFAEPDGPARFHWLLARR